MLWSRPRILDYDVPASYEGCNTMPIEPKDETLRKALRWICQQRQHDQGAGIAALVEQAGEKFNLSPLDEEFLWRSLVEGPNPSEP